MPCCCLRLVCSGLGLAGGFSLLDVGKYAGGGWGWLYALGMAVDDPKSKLEAPWEQGEVEFVDRMFDDPLFVDPAEAEELALRDLEEGMVVEGELQAVLAAGVSRLDRVLKALSEDYDPGDRRLEFSLSPAAAPLFGLRDALEFGLSELRGRWSATPSLVRKLEGMLVVGREQLVALGTLELLPEMGVVTLEPPAVRGRAVFGWWWEAAGLVERVFLRAAMAAPGFMTTEALLTRDGRLDVRRIDSAGERLQGGQLQLMGLVRGLWLLRDGSPTEVESGVRLLITSWMGDQSWWGGLDSGRLN